MLDPARLEANWRAVLEKIALAARKAGRSSQDLRLVAVSKFHPPEAVALLAGLGQQDFGENYVQESRAKQDYMQRQFPEIPVRWHAIGPIQSNKARDVAGHFRLIHSVSSVKLAQALSARLAGNAMQDILIQVNIGEEGQKNGVLPHSLPALVEEILPVPGLVIQGLMCLPPHCGEGELARPYFARLRTLRDDMEQRFGLKLPHLSMGMSGDFAEAIEEGATLVRIGTSIFGARA